MKAKLKFIILGDSNVGKTSLLYSWKHGVFNLEYSSTIGVDLFIKHTEHNGEKIKIYFWDTAGQERFMSITRNYLNGLDGAVVVYDITNMKSFLNTSTWIQEVRNINPNTNIILIGNKCDKNKHRQVSYEQGLSLASKMGIRHFEVSATCSKLDEVFSFLIKGLEPNTIREEEEEQNCKPVSSCCF